MNDNTEVRDELARLAGWTKTTPAMCDHQPVPIGSQWHRSTGSGSPGSLTWCIHPIPNTLDEASKLPQGWFWSSIHDRSDRFCRAAASRISNGIAHEVGGMWKPSEKTARFETRLAVEKIEHERRNK